jgi:hypothetical protein
LSNLRPVHVLMFSSTSIAAVLIDGALIDGAVCDAVVVMSMMFSFSLQL